MEAISFPAANSGSCNDPVGLLALFKAKVMRKLNRTARKGGPGRSELRHNPGLRAERIDELLRAVGAPDTPIRDKAEDPPPGGPQVPPAASRWVILGPFGHTDGTRMAPGWHTGTPLETHRRSESPRVYQRHLSVSAGVSAGSAVHTDGWTGYRNLGKLG